MSEMKIPDDLQVWYGVACDGIEFKTGHAAIKVLIERIARLEAERDALILKHNEQAKESNRWTLTALQTMDELRAENATLRDQRAARKGAEVEPRKIFISHAQGDSDVVGICGGLPNQYLKTFDDDESAQKYIDSGQAAEDLKKADAQRAARKEQVR